ncbi:cysteine desulfurase family protein [Pedobacter sp. AW1-32]|uniref:cysteine desulfurase family protein n=1 Tax=Pedobacter sp. AW1-32 TaxID=3383026 RepID=UPI003FF018A1
MSIYLDNAATTPLSAEVFAEMKPYFFHEFANPSSAHAAGRHARQAIEQSRSQIADWLNTSPEHIFFTSGGTEADNMAILSAIYTQKIRVVITSRLEHHAVLNTLKRAERDGLIKLVFLSNDEKGNLSLKELDRLLDAQAEQVLISLMHGNNEIANLNPIYEIADLAEHYGAVFHCDTIQTMGHFRYDVRQMTPDFLVGSAHKFHGPKGTGFLYSRLPKQLTTLITGGAQENGKRAGTENVAGILGMAAAFQEAYLKLDEYEQHLKHLKAKLIAGLSAYGEFSFNGNSAEIDKSLSTVLSISVPDGVSNGNLLQHLDLSDIYASGGSACSGNGLSHVISALQAQNKRNTIRFSFSRYNTEHEIDQVLAVIQQYARQQDFESILRSA